MDTIELLAWAYQKLCAFGMQNSTSLFTIEQMDRIKQVLEYEVESDQNRKIG